MIKDDEFSQTNAQENKKGSLSVTHTLLEGTRQLPHTSRHTKEKKLQFQFIVNLST